MSGAGPGQLITPYGGALGNLLVSDEERPALRADRDTNILRIGFVASEVVRAGGR